MTEFRPRAFRTASAGAVENLGRRHQKLCGNKLKRNVNQDLRKREGTRSSRSNCTSSNEAAMPYHPGMEAGSWRWTCALVASTTLPWPIGLLTRTTSISIEAPTGSGLGQRKYTPVELISRVTSVTGNSSGVLLILRSRRGSLRVARGYSRCSG